MTVSTKLIVPNAGSGPDLGEGDFLDQLQPKASPDGSEPPPLSTSLLSQHNQDDMPSTLERIIVRIEVTDTGCGIKPRDMVESKLFCKCNL